MATETVVGIQSVQSVQTKAGQASKRGTEYEVADGDRIPNFGKEAVLGGSPRKVSRDTPLQDWKVKNT